MTLALSKAIGALKAGAIESSAREETLMDLFTEQAIWPTIIATFREGYSPVGPVSYPCVSKAWY